MTVTRISVRFTDKIFWCFWWLVTSLFVIRMPPKAELKYADGKAQWHITTPWDLCVRIKRPPVNKVAQRPTTVKLGSISSIRIVKRSKKYTVPTLSIETDQGAFILHPNDWYVNYTGPLLSLPAVACCMDPSKSSMNSSQRMSNIYSYFDCFMLMCLLMFGYCCVNHFACLICLSLFLHCITRSISGSAWKVAQGK